MADESYLDKILHAPLRDFLQPAPAAREQGNAADLYGQMLDHAAGYAIEVLRDNKVKPLPAQADLRAVLDLSLRGLGVTTEAVSAILPVGALGEVVSALPQLLRAAAPLRDLIGSLFQGKQAIQTLIARTRADPRPGRWNPSDAEMNYFARFSGDDLITAVPTSRPRASLKAAGPKFPVSARTMKIVELFGRGPIPKTEDVGALTARVRQGEGEQVFQIAWAGGGYRPAQMPAGGVGLRLRAQLGTMVHNAVERRYRFEHPMNTVLCDTVVYRDGATAQLAEYEHVDPHSADIMSVRLRMAYEAFMFYRGDESVGRHNLRADILDMSSMEVFEIKPRASAAKAALQSWLYKGGFNSVWKEYASGALDPDVGFVHWGRGWPRNRMEIPLGRKYMAVVAAGKVPGLILYELYEKVPDDEEDKQAKRRVWEECVRRAIDNETARPVPVGVGVPQGPRVPQPAGQPGRMPGTVPASEEEELVPPEPSWWPDIEVPGANDNEETVPGKGDEEVAGESEGDLAAAREAIALILAALLTFLIYLVMGALGGVGIRLSPAPSSSSFAPIGPTFPINWGEDPPDYRAALQKLRPEHQALFHQVTEMIHELARLEREVRRFDNSARGGPASLRS